MNSLLNLHKNNRKLITLVENRTTYSADYAELNIYETYAFDFFLGESVVMPTNKEMMTPQQFKKSVLF